MILGTSCCLPGRLHTRTPDPPERTTPSPRTPQNDIFLERGGGGVWIFFPPRMRLQIGRGAPVNKERMAPYLSLLVSQKQLFLLQA